MAGETRVDWEAPCELYARVVTDPGWLISVSAEITEAIHAAIDR